MRKYFFLIAIAIVVLDRLAKAAVASSISLHDSVTVIPGLFSLTHVENTGAAFGLFADSNAHWKIGALVMFSVIALIIVSAILWKHSDALTTTTIGLSLILGGASGNLWDRLLSGHVVDFLDFHVGNYYWPAFNVADSAIVVGAVLLVAEILFTKPVEEPAKESALHD